MLRLYFSNRFETLHDQLFDDLASAPDDPFVAEQIIVPGTAIRRRLEMDYADHFGICANVTFGYLAQWIWQQIGLVIEVPETSPFDAERLVWRIFRAFGDASLVAPHPRLAAYLAKADPVMRYTFAQRLARQFEQYITYRPDWLAAWAEHRSVFEVAGSRDLAQDERWQAALWRHLTDELAIGPEHPSVRFLRRLEAPGGDDAPQTGKLRPAALFCLPTIPPLYLDILARVAEWVELRLYVMSPCAEYWHDLVDAKRMARLNAAGQADYHEVGHRLLAGWGRQTQAFVALLHEKTAGRGLEWEEHAPSGRDSLLAALQDEILTLEPATSGTVPEADRSLEIHVCHSLTRELEVLHDQLLDLLSGPEGLKPAEILVVMPALEDAAPLIHAVFGTAPEDRHIPYVVTGLPPAAANPAATTLLALLGLLDSRFKASEVFDLLRRPLVRARFGFDDEALERIRDWMRQSGIRWGLDGAHRAELGLPGFDHYSLHDGLDRLFLGYAVPQLPEALGERLPAGDAEGAAALALGGFDHYITCLQEARRESREPAAGDRWRQRLNGWIDTFLQLDGASIHEITEVRSAVAALCDDLGSGAPQEALGLDVIGAALRERLEDPAHGAMPSGAVTFAGMSPMRHLPYRVICMLGLNDGAFPAVDRPDEFDLLAAAPRLGDRQRRCDDRNVFLDLVLAAQDRLYLSYTGFSLRDNSALTPSLLLAELLDHACGLLAGDTASEETLQAVRRRLVVQHPLQPFSPAYFSRGGDADPRLFSYAAEYVPTCAAPVPVEALGATVDAPDDEEAVREIGAPFFLQPLAWPVEEAHALTLDDLKRFLRNPCRFLLERRLNLVLREADEELADDESFLEDFGQRGVLAERLLPAIRAGAGQAAVAALAQAGTEYPSGAYGDVLCERELTRIVAFGQAVAAAMPDAPRPPVAGTLEFLLDGQRWVLSGALNDLRRSGLVRWRYDDTRPSDYLMGWLDHLFLNALAPSEVPPGTVWLSRNGAFRLRPCHSARTYLEQLVAIFRRGLTQPSRFFPKSAWAYILALPKGTDTALQAAHKVWAANDHTGGGESTGTAYRLALRGLENPLDAAFEDAAIAVFGPLREHLEDERLP